MAWYADLSPCDYFTPCDYFGPRDPEKLRAVGWLGEGQEYSVGPLNPNVFEKLKALSVSPWSPVLFGGCHECELCTGRTLGYFNLFIPGPKFLYVCPELITHYIGAHNYSPPQEFCEAVLACPPMGSADYLAAIAANGGEIFGLGGTESSRKNRTRPRADST